MANEKRLIDANVLIKETASIINFRKQHYMPTIEQEALLGYVKKLPTVDAVEVVHGRWIGDGWGSYIKRCSVCRSVPLREVGGRHDACYSNYCPNCGAKMDGDGNGQ